ncbi:epoxyqueuosine reductase [Sulfurirhabdus autotrophica]|uniref:Epoxyqueuosine reductase n=1 Tax=Sulfurirhabdus autotrophica TaxID=1706046 RepID=A0A4R3Y5D6_9PROT|nr:epoxyqueuosine reductase [Sulfurirhabdus autotrophica]
MDFDQLAADIKSWGKALGFQTIGISDVNLDAAEKGLMNWLAKGFHGDMDYMAKHGTKRSRPAEILPGTSRIITARLNYRPPAARDSWETLHDGNAAFISRYALGRDYHKVMRKRLQQLTEKIQAETGAAHFRVFTDSAPVMEVALAQKSGIGWRGKHTLLLTRDHGSWFFLGEIFTDLPLPVDPPIVDHCGTCQSCIDICPTQAIVAPYQVDARRCISYLTIELHGSIPIELRPLIGNRVYGCDDCQLTCPWNKFAQTTGESDFHVRHGLDNITLIQAFGWTEQLFHKNMAGSAIHRIGYERWLRNIAVGLGNAPTSGAVIAALESRLAYPSQLVQEHVKWALTQHQVST